jgi:hypothetical protein
MLYIQDMECFYATTLEPITQLFAHEIDADSTGVVIGTLDDYSGITKVPFTKPLAMLIDSLSMEALTKGQMCAAEGDFNARPIVVKLKSKPMALHTFTKTFTMLQLSLKPIVHTPKAALMVFDDTEDSTCEIRARIWQPTCDKAMFIAWKGYDKANIFFNLRAVLGPNTIAGPVSGVKYLEPAVAGGEGEKEKPGCVITWFRIEKAKLDVVLHKSGRESIVFDQTPAVAYPSIPVREAHTFADACKIATEQNRRPLFRHCPRE